MYWSVFGCAEANVNLRINSTRTQTTLHTILIFVSIIFHMFVSLPPLRRCIVVTAAAAAVVAIVRAFLFYLAIAHTSTLTIFLIRAQLLDT